MKKEKNTVKVINLYFLDFMDAFTKENPYTAKIEINIPDTITQRSGTRYS
jgi:hypothetical protein